LSDCSVDPRRAFDYGARLAQQDVRRCLYRGQPAVFGFQFEAKQPATMQDENVGQARLGADGFEDRGLDRRSIAGGRMVPPVQVMMAANRQVLAYSAL